MKNSWVILTILPVLGLCYEGTEDFFYFNDQSDEALYHIAYDEAESLESTLPEREEFDQETLTLFQSDLDTCEDLPWREEMTGEEITSFVEQRARQMTPDYDDVFAYEVPTYREKQKAQPTAEKVPEDSRHFFGRPRVVQSKPEEESRTERRRVKRPPIAEKNETQDRVITNSSVSEARD